MPLDPLKWYLSPYTGLFAESGAVPRYAYDPDVFIWSGVLPGPYPGEEIPASGGAGWDPISAELAGVGEAIERWQSWPLPDDGSIQASFHNWPLEEAAVDPKSWVLFHPDQYALDGFPFEPLNRNTECRWVCFRTAVGGEPIWVPEELAFLSLPFGVRNRFCPMISTGLSSGRWDDPVLLRGAQEVIERDAIVGAWWGRYPIEEWPAKEIFQFLGETYRERLTRPNLTYRFYRIDTPFSSHTTLVSVEGETEEGYCFSVGAACRETRTASWLKSLLECIQSRHHVRFLKGDYRRRGKRIDIPTSFAEHGLYFSQHPERLKETVLNGARTPKIDRDPLEGLPQLIEKLDDPYPILFRDLTPPAIATDQLGWRVLRVLIPGLQPLHGHHALPFLGGPLWGSRTWTDWQTMLPHPIP
jgi:ribosomal protein S12 methylthiotransferase accessory factor